MWTHSGIVVHRQGNKIEVFASSVRELAMFADENGTLQEQWLEDANDSMKEEGWYQVDIGYGTREPFRAWYSAVKIAEAGWRNNK